MNNILFLCSGNYYRSRFAEILFNHFAAQESLPWRADSRGLALSPDNLGPISAHALFGLEKLGILVHAERRMPLALTENDLQVAHHIVAVKRAEHFPLVEKLFPAWTKRVEFWEIHDLDCALPDDALPQLEKKVRALLARLRDW
jgi:protein-tyrosine phosphatase